MEALDKLSYAVDLASMVSHGCVRTFVLGHERCNQGDVRGGAHSNGLTLEEKQAVADCVKEAIQAGAVGFSTNRFSGHRDTSGVLVPGTLADVDEVVMIAKAVAEGGGGMFEMAADFACCAPALFSSFWAALPPRQKTPPSSSSPLSDNTSLAVLRRRRHPPAGARPGPHG